MKNLKYVVEVFDGTTGENYEYESLEEAKKHFEEEKEYHDRNNYKYEFIELNSYDEDDNLIENILSI